MERKIGGEGEGNDNSAGGEGDKTRRRGAEEEKDIFHIGKGEGECSWCNSRTTG